MFVNKFFIYQIILIHFIKTTIFNKMVIVSEVNLIFKKSKIDL
ncbi:hypothetical protein JCM19302_3958 [Jejuia pallidilutea]|uniref:Uncharacterized protein n=1 Tax=Jejuia pallidilutea TaxID=504487 RepID=A0A090W172_9FLAO|nr:hypothetical protein JCM19302_3958 [Jejuia pallidilutea]GAL89218.1 hypothetical protein JCM19538_2881 [Jejuia pallidilutea]